MTAAKNKNNGTVIINRLKEWGGGDFSKLQLRISYELFNLCTKL